LQEYFYGDFAKIGLVLGNGFIKKERPDNDQVFATFDHEYANELAEKNVFNYRPMNEITEVDFIRVYDESF